MCLHLGLALNHVSNQCLFYLGLIDYHSPTRNSLLSSHCHSWLVPGRIRPLASEAWLIWATGWRHLVAQMWGAVTWLKLITPHHANFPTRDRRQSSIPRCASWDHEVPGSWKRYPVLSNTCTTLYPWFNARWWYLQYAGNGNTVIWHNWVIMLTGICDSLLCFVFSFIYQCRLYNNIRIYNISFHWVSGVFVQHRHFVQRLKHLLWGANGPLGIRKFLMLHHLMVTH